jgi:hypothetical protein
VKAVNETPSTRRNYHAHLDYVESSRRLDRRCPHRRFAGAGSPGTKLRPFAFQTSSGQNFAPGVYTIRMNGEHTMVIRGTKTSGMAMTQLANDSLPATKGKAVFTHYGDRYFLRAVWVAGQGSHLLCSSSKAERQSQIAAVKTSSPVELALLQEGR